MNERYHSTVAVCFSDLKLESVLVHGSEAVIIPLLEKT